jgi:beta-mannosidase
MRMSIADLFGDAAPLRSDGFVIAEMDQIRVARRIQDAPAQQMCPHNVSVQARVTGTQVHVHLEAEYFSYEVTLLPELVADGAVQVSQQLFTLLPGDEVDVVIDAANISDAQNIATRIEEITWSLNRLMNER